MHTRRNERNTIAPDHIVRIVVHRPSVETGIPYSPKHRPQSWEYPYTDMNVGDSFHIMGTESRRDTVSSRIHVHNNQHPETFFSCRAQLDEHGEKLTRVWRTR